MEGYFWKDTYWFKPKHCHTCNKGRGGTTRMHADHRPKIQMIWPAPLWNISFEYRRWMRAVLEGCPDGWWEILPKQGPSRRWPKGINEIGNMTGGGVRQQIEAMMRLYLDFIKNQYPCLRYWRVEALQTKPNTQSQYKKWGNQLHSDYSETALQREPGERPMSMIMALDESSIFYTRTKTSTMMMTI
jgi:hypothetical protein